LFKKQKLFKLKKGNLEIWKFLLFGHCSVIVIFFLKIWVLKNEIFMCKVGKTLGDYYVA